MKTITMTDLKKRGAKAISDEEITILIVNSKPKIAMVPYNQYEMMMEDLENLEDLATYLERKDGEYIPYDEFMKSLEN